MDSLNQARMTIDSVDREMAKLFAERMQAAAVIAAYKEEHGLPVEDIAREDELIARNSGLVPPAYRPYYTNFLKQLINESKKYQNLLLSKARLHMSPQYVFSVTMRKKFLARISRPHTAGQKAVNVHVQCYRSKTVMQAM